jgi:uncharacterized protein (TIGR00251 family)
LTPAPPAARAVAGGVVLDLLVTPRAARERVGPVIEGRLKIAVMAPPVEGEANAAVCKLVARALAVPPRDVSVLRGATGRRKSVRVEGISLAAIEAFLDGV